MKSFPKGFLLFLLPFLRLAVAIIEFIEGWGE